MIKLCIPDIRQPEIDAAVEVLNSGWLAHGPYNKKFEEAFAEYVAVKHAITCNSCTSALGLVLQALEITGEVIIPSFSFAATANAVVTTGATPRFVDIHYNTCNIDPQKIRQAITPATQAIIVVHFGGQCCQMDAVEEIAKERGLHLIEDSAETLGGTYHGRQAGSFGHGCFSFFPTKNITSGEGGMITTNDDAMARNIRALIGHGMDSSTYEREKAEMPWFRSAIKPGYNFRMSNVLAAIGYEQMKRLDEMNAARQRHASYLIKGLKEISKLDLPYTQDGCNHVYQMFTIKVDPSIDRVAFVKFLNEQGIGASVHFYPPIHEQGYYKEHTEWQADSLEVTADVARRIVTLPLFPTISTRELDEIISTVDKGIALFSNQ
jgi:perosamine synthetase